MISASGEVVEMDDMAVQSAGVGAQRRSEESSNTANWYNIWKAMKYDLTLSYTHFDTIKNKHRGTDGQ